MLKYYLMEAVEPTLLLAPLCSVVGIIAASRYSKVGMATALLLVLGVFFAQMAVNVLNDYVDYSRGIDKESTKTKFSGGSRLIVDGFITPRGTLALGLLAFAISAAIGIHFIIANPIIIPLVVIGAFSVALYASHLTKIPFLAEPVTALNFMLCGLGSFMVINSSASHLLAGILVCFPAGMVVGMSLLINEMPDRKVDRKYGRRSGAVILKSNGRIAYYYLLWQLAGYASIIFGIVSGMVPYLDMIFIIAVPFMLLCFMAMKKYASAEKFEKYMGINALYAILFIILLIAGYAI